MEDFDRTPRLKASFNLLKERIRGSLEKEKRTLRWKYLLSIEPTTLGENTLFPCRIYLFPFVNTQWNPLVWFTFRISSFSVDLFFFCFWLSEEPDHSFVWILWRWYYGWCFIRWSRAHCYRWSLSGNLPSAFPSWAAYLLEQLHRRQLYWWGNHFLISSSYWSFGWLLKFSTWKIPPFS